MLKRTSYYLKKTLTFFDLKAKALPPVIFLLTLGASAAYSYLQPPLPIPDPSVFSDPNQLAAFYSVDFQVSPAAGFARALAAFGIVVLMNIFSFIYLSAAIREARGEDYSAGICVFTVLKNFFRLLIVTAIKNILMLLGLLLFIVPGIYAALTFLFAECAILDGRAGAVMSLPLSSFLTRGKKAVLFRILLLCNLVIFIFTYLLLSFFFTSGPAVFQYVFLFLLSICVLMEQKLVAFLYADVAPFHLQQQESSPDSSDDPDAGQE